MSLHLHDCQNPRKRRKTHRVVMYRCSVCGAVRPSEGRQRAVFQMEWIRHQWVWRFYCSKCRKHSTCQHCNGTGQGESWHPNGKCYVCQGSGKGRWDA